MRSISGTNAKNIKGEEADAVMIMILENTETNDIQKFHDTVGHSTFVNIAITDDEETHVKKVHRYFGHRSGRRVWDIFAKAKKMKGKRKAVMEVIENCKICSQFKKSPPRPRVGIPVANNFNEIVGLDLKVISKTRGEYILWIVDLFSKLIKGKYIKNKRPETIIDGIVNTWVIGDGAGLGHPRRGFWSDNGGEFLNSEVLNYAAAMDVNIKMTSAEAPWQNGIVERHHATADIIYEKLLKENPSMDPQEAVNHASFAKNTDTNKTGFSPIQLMTGQNPAFPGLAEANPASSNVDSSSKYMKTLKSIDSARVRMREIDCDNKLKKVRSERINPNVEKFYDFGDPIFFFDEKKKEWKKATALIRLGKTIYLRFGNFLRRVPVEKVRPDLDGERDLEDSYVDTDNDADEERFKEEETPVIDMSLDLDLNDKNKNLQEKMQNLAEKDTIQVEKIASLEAELAAIRDAKADNAENLDVNEDEALLRERILIKRKDKKRAQKAKKQAEQLKVPKTGQNILFKENNSTGWKSGRIVASWKKNSKYKYWKHVMVDRDIIVEKDFENKDLENGVLEWKLDDD